MNKMIEDFKLETGSIEQAKAIQNNYREAQRWCNFVLLKPEWLPEDVKILEQSLRPEQGDNKFSSYRIMAKGLGRSLSIKEFLFDFAPPAYDHPCLWRNPKTTKEGEFPVPKAYPLNENVLWIGHDHRRLPAATAGLHRARVEITALEGDFSDQEFLKIFENLIPADESYAKTIKNTPFSVLSYQYRHEKRATDVELSYWHYKRNSKDIHWAKVSDEATLLALPIQAPALVDFGYSLDSVFVIRPENDNPSEIDFVYEAKERNGAYLRLLVSPSGSQYPIPYPPKRNTQECNIETLEIDGHTVYKAWLTSRYGPYEASFLYQERSALLLAQPSVWTNESWFSELVEHIILAM